MWAPCFSDCGLSFAAREQIVFGDAAQISHWHWPGQLGPAALPLTAALTVG